MSFSLNPSVAGPHDILFIHRTYQQTSSQGRNYLLKMEAGEDVFAELDEEEDDEDEEDEDEEDTTSMGEVSWSEEEERRLLTGLKTYGDDWAAVTKLVETR